MHNRRHMGIALIHYSSSRWSNPGGEVQQEEIGIPDIVLRGKLVKKCSALPTLQHLQDGR